MAGCAPDPDAGCASGGPAFLLAARTVVLSAEYRCRVPARASAPGLTIAGRYSVDNPMRQIGRNRPRVEQALAVVNAVVPRQFERLPLEGHVLGQTRCVPNCDGN